MVRLNINNDDALIDKFASDAMKSLLPDFYGLHAPDRKLVMKQIAEVSYQMAIIMMEERKKYYD